MTLRDISLSQTESNYPQVVELEGEDYIFYLLWNARDQHWYLTMQDSSGSDIITGFKVTVGYPIALYASDERFPPGRLWALDPSGSETDPGLRDFGTRVTLTYEESS